MNDNEIFDDSLNIDSTESSDDQIITTIGSLEIISDDDLNIFDESKPTIKHYLINLTQESNEEKNTNKNNSNQG